MTVLLCHEQKFSPDTVDTISFNDRAMFHHTNSDNFPICIIFSHYLRKMGSHVCHPHGAVLRNLNLPQLNQRTNPIFVHETRYNLPNKLSTSSSEKAKSVSDGDQCWHIRLELHHFRNQRSLPLN